jgi:hypothetical protein
VFYESCPFCTVARNTLRRTTGRFTYTCLSAQVGGMKRVCTLVAGTPDVAQRSLPIQVLSFRNCYHVMETSRTAGRCLHSVCNGDSAWCTCLHSEGSREHHLPTGLLKCKAGLVEGSNSNANRSRLTNYRILLIPHIDSGQL